MDLKTFDVYHPAFDTEFSEATTKGLLTITFANTSTGEVYAKKQVDDLLTLHTLNLIADMFSEFFDSLPEDDPSVVCLIEDRLHKDKNTLLFYQDDDDAFTLCVQYDGNQFTYTQFIKYLLKD